VIAAVVTATAVAAQVVVIAAGTVVRVAKVASAATANQSLRSN